MKKAVFSGFVLILVLTAASHTAFTQTEADKNANVDKEISLLRHDLRSDKKKIIAANVPLTEAEATKFWPVYDQYTDEIRKNNDQLLAIIKEYAANQATLTDDQALNMVKRWADVQVSLAQTRQKYIPVFAKVLPGKKAALFLQLDHRLYMLIDIQTTSDIPLVVP